MEVGGSPRWVATSVVARVHPRGFPQSRTAGFTTRRMSRLLMWSLWGLGSMCMYACASGATPFQELGKHLPHLGVPPLQNSGRLMPAREV